MSTARAVTMIPSKAKKEFALKLGVVSKNKSQKQGIAQIDEESARIEAVIEKMIAENSRKAIDQDDYNQKYSSYAVRYKQLEKQKEELLDENAACKAKGNQMKAFIKELKKYRV